MESLQMLNFSFIKFSLLFLTILTAFSCKKEHNNKILIIGDSISENYFYYLKDHPTLKIERITGNALHSRSGVRRIKEWVGNSRWMLCTLNHGIHDSKLEVKMSNKEYIKNISFELEYLKNNCDKVLLINSTKIPAKVVFPDYNIPSARGVELNNILAKLATKFSIPLCDLYSVSEKIPHLYLNAEEENNVHFLNEGYKVLSLKVEECIKEVITTNSWFT